MNQPTTTSSKENNQLDELIGQLSLSNQQSEELIKSNQQEQQQEHEQQERETSTEAEPEIPSTEAEPEIPSTEIEQQQPIIITTPEQVEQEQETPTEEQQQQQPKPSSQLDNLLEEFNQSNQWKQSSSFYKLTNRSTPTLPKTTIQLPPPPLPTADDLSLEKLKLVDQAFTPPTTQPQPQPQPQPITNTKPLNINHHQQLKPEQQRSSSLLLPAHQTQNEQTLNTPTSIESSQTESDLIGQAYQPTYQQQQQQQQHHPHPHHYSYPQSNQQHYPTHHLIQRQNHPSISSLNSVYNNYQSSSASSSLSPSTGPITPTNQSQYPIRQYYPDHHPGLATTSNIQQPPQQQPGYGPLSYSIGPSGYRDNNTYHPANNNNNNKNHILSQSQGLPGLNSLNLAQAGFGPSLQPTSSSPASSLHHVGLTRSGTSLSNTSSHSNMLIAPAINSIHHPSSRPPALMPPKTGPTISKASIDEYRNRIKSDPDPEAHFNYAKFLIEAARKLASGGAAGDDKAIKKYRDTLLQESLKLIKKLATQGVGLGKPPYSDAQFFLANCLGNGSLGLQVDHEKAYNLYVQASKQNHPAATYRTAVCNELGAGTRKDAQRAMLFYRKASALGDTAGMYKLGMILLAGLLGQPKNPQEALLWLKRAAQQADEDNPHALHELAQIYEKPPLVTIGPAATPGGKHGGSAGTPQISYLVQRDEPYARELYTQAAQLGYPASQNRLGACYEYGALSCPVDPRRSIGWYTKAAERGDAESELALSGWYLTGSEGVLKQSDSEAYLWARRAASKGLPKAEYAVGYYAEVGIGVKQDIEEAKRWYMRAATNKNKRAMQRLTELKKMGSQKPAKRQARPTRDQAASECLIV